MSLLRHDFVPQPVDITILFVTSKKKPVTQLSEQLSNSAYIRNVEWIDSEQQYEAKVKRHLFDRRPQQAFIVVLDFNTCGSRVWTLISSVHDFIPHGNFEWVVTGYCGLVPCMPRFPWGSVTLLPETSA